MRLASLTLMTLLSVVSGEEAAPPLDPHAEVAARIHHEGMTEGQAFAMLSDLCTQAPHRLAGSPGAAAAVEWAEQKLTAFGFENVRREECFVPHWRRGAPERLVVVEPAHAAGMELPVLALGGSIATPPGGITAEVIAVQTFEELEALGDEAQGKIVLFNRPMDPTLPDTFRAYGGAVGQRAQGAVRAASAGGVAALVRSMTTRIDDNPHTGGMNYRIDVERVPGAAVSTRAAEWIAGELALGRKVVLHLEMHCETLPDKLSANVVGEIVGRELPDEIVLVGGHLDCWDVGQGAHDDGSGVIQAIEAARLLQELELRPRRTIRVVCYMNEENGTRGARAYVRQHADSLDQHVLALESDRGGFAPRGFTSNANPEAMTILRELASVLEPIDAHEVVKGGGGVDISFLEPSGVVLVGYLPDDARYFDVHHSPNDTLDQVNPRELQLGAIAIATLLHGVADREEVLPRNERRSRRPR